MGTCYEYNHPQTKDLNESLTWCRADLKLNYSSGPNDLEELRGGQTVDIMVDIKFIDGKNHSSINKVRINSCDIYIANIKGEKMLYFYRKEDPSSIDCVVL